MYCHIKIRYARRSCKWQTSKQANAHISQPPLRDSTKCKQQDKNITRWNYFSIYYLTICISLGLSFILIRFVRNPKRRRQIETERECVCGGMRESGRGREGHWLLVHTEWLCKFSSCSRIYASRGYNMSTVMGRTMDPNGRKCCVYMYVRMHEMVQSVRGQSKWRKNVWQGKSDEWKYESYSIPHRTETKIIIIVKYCVKQKFIHLWIFIWPIKIMIMSAMNAKCVLCKKRSKDKWMGDVKWDCEERHQ